MYTKRVFILLLSIAVWTVVSAADDQQEEAPEDVCLEVRSAELTNACTYAGLQITAKSGTLLYDSNCSVLLPKQLFKEKPTVLYGSANRTKLYTLVAIDPDAPKLKPGQFYLHWLSANIPGDILADNKIVEKSYDITSYTGPNPPADTGDHRYMFFVYEQREGSIPTDTVARKPFDMDVFSKGKQLCGPLAGIQFRSTH